MSIRKNRKPVETMPAFIDGVDMRHIPDFPGYAVSSDGRVFSCRNSNGHEWRELKRTENPLGYSRVVVCQGYRPRNLFVHKLVLIAFDRKPIAGEVAMHVDDNPRNNSIGNLRWGTQKENVASAIASRRHLSCSGSNPLLKFSDQEIKLIISAYRSGASGSQVAKIYGCSRSYVTKLAGKQYIRRSLEA